MCHYCRFVIYFPVVMNTTLSRSWLYALVMHFVEHAFDSHFTSLGFGLCPICLGLFFSYDSLWCDVFSVLTCLQHQLFSKRGNVGMSCSAIAFTLFGRLQHKNVCVCTPDCWVRAAIGVLPVIRVNPSLFTPITVDAALRLLQFHLWSVREALTLHLCHCCLVLLDLHSAL